MTDMNVTELMCKKWQKEPKKSFSLHVFHIGKGKTGKSVLEPKSAA